MSTVFSGVLVAQGSRFLRRSLRFCSSSNANLRSCRAFGMDAASARASSNGCVGVVRFPLATSSALVIQKGDITKWSIDGSTDAIVCKKLLSLFVLEEWFFETMNYMFLA